MNQSALQDFIGFAGVSEPDPNPNGLLTLPWCGQQMRPQSYGYIEGGPMHDLQNYSHGLMTAPPTIDSDGGLHNEISNEKNASHTSDPSSIDELLPLPESVHFSAEIDWDAEIAAFLTPKPTGRGAHNARHERYVL